MRSAVRSTHRPDARAAGGAFVPARRRLLVALALWPLAPALRAAEVELNGFELTRRDDGLYLDYAVDFELPHAVEEALNKAVPLYFVAEANVYRDRWYWRDKRVSRATRTWRIVFQPLTFTYRVTFAGLSQNFSTRAEAFAAMRRGIDWKIADAGRIEEGSRHYVEFSFRLDTTLLPRPMQIGIGDQPDWTLNVEHSQRFD